MIVKAYKKVNPFNTKIPYTCETLSLKLNEEDNSDTFFGSGTYRV